MLQAREGGAGVEVGAGQGVELHCHSQGGRPPAEIHWWDSDTGSKLVADMRGGYIVHSTLYTVHCSPYLCNTPDPLFRCWIAVV